MLTSGIPIGEMFRYTVIDDGPRIPRPSKHFSHGQYLACQIDNDYLSGRIIEVTGRDPAIVKICMDQGRSVCGGGVDGCDFSCPFRLLTLADNGAVLNTDDIIFGVLGYRHYEFIDPNNAEKILAVIEKLERRQRGC